MARLAPDILNAVLANCQARWTDIAESLGRATHLELKALAAAEPKQVAAIVADNACPGLVTLSMVGSSAAVIAIADHDQLLPAWCAAPDASGHARLATLSHELGMLLLPDGVIADNWRAGYVPDIGNALRRGQFIEATAISLAIANPNGRRMRLLMLWPALNPDAILTAGKHPQPARSMSGGSPSSGRAAPGELPIYSRSLLKIRLPVTVTLASKRQPLGRIVELGPGAIIHFDKSCEEMLDLEVGGQSIAQGEPIKVGDKFGIRLTSLVMPCERFLPLGKPKG